MAETTWCTGCDAARLLVGRCLKRDGSLFDPSEEAEIWTLGHAEELESRIGVPDDEQSGSFIDKLVAQLDGLEPGPLQLAYELLFVEPLGENDTGAAKKKEHLARIAGPSSVLTPMPEEFETALEGASQATALARATATPSCGSWSSS